MKEVLAVALCRVSSIEQLENDSLDHQKVNVLKEASRLGARIPDDAIWEGAVSSKKGVNFNRKDLLQIYEYCKKHPNVKYLIVQEVDRFMRSADEQTYWYMRFWHELGVRVWFADKPELNEDTHVASLLRYMEGWRAGGSNEERKNKSINGQTGAGNNGRYTYGPKSGYMKGVVAGVHEIHPERGIALQKVLKRLAAGLVSPTNALIELNKSSYTKTRAPLKMDKFRIKVTDPFYTGVIAIDAQVKVYNKYGLHKPLITFSEHLRIVEIMDAKPKYQTGPKRTGNPKYPLNNIVSHDTCLEKKNKGRFVGYDHGNGQNLELVYEKYRCRSCNRYWHKEELHNGIVDLFNRYEMSVETRKKIIAALDIVWVKDRENRAAEVVSMKSAITRTEKAIDEKVDSATDSSNSAIKEDILRIIEKKKSDLSKLQLELDRLISDEEDDKNRFMEFALGFIQDTGRYFLEPYVTKEYRLACKQMLFPAEIYVNQDGKVYTPKLSVFYRGEITKKDAETSDIGQMVRVGGL